MKKKKRRIVIFMVILMGLYLFGFSQLLGAVSAMEDFYPAYSLRYHTPLNDSALTSARSYAKEPQSLFWPTFWRQGKTTIESKLGPIETSALFFNGNAETVYPANFLSGGYPGALPGKSCALSADLAFQLWGSLDVVGKTLRLDGYEYTVSGVFAGEEPHLLAAEEAPPLGEGWKQVELEVQKGESIFGADREAAKTFATNAGLGQPDSIISGPSLNQLLGMSIYLILLLPISLFLLTIKSYFPKKSSHLRFIIYFVIALALAVWLPNLLSAAPPWLIPNRWSDMSHWQNVGNLVSQRLMEWFALIPTMKDVLAKMQLLALGIWWLSLILLPIIIYYFRLKLLYVKEVELAKDNDILVYSTIELETTAENANSLTDPLEDWTLPPVAEEDYP